MATDTSQRRIVIVGGGIMGTSTLYHLAHSPSLAPQTHISLVEAASSLAPAASGRSGGFLAQDWHGAATASIADLSYRLHRELAEKDGGGEKWGWREVDTMSVRFDDSKSKASNKLPSSLQWVKAEHVTKASNMGGGGTTAQVTPLPLVNHLAEEAEKKLKERGRTFDLLLNNYAEKATIKDGRIESLDVESTSSGSDATLPCTDLILSAGPWMGQLVPSLFPRPFINSHRFLSSASHIDGSRAHSVVIRGSAPTSNHCLFTDMSFQSTKGGRQKAAAPEVYARADGTVYVCGGSDDVPLPRLASEVKHDSRKTADLLEQAAHLSPHVLDTTSGPKAGATVEKEQACYLPIAERSDFIVAGDKKSGVWVGGGGASCWGITMGLGTGKCVSEMVLDGTVKSADVSMLQG
ncbi:FAD dependent oxidoreductase [Jaminaea rosea]|uniref:FAD dependent oxidoreductase n=1 Tax=Jaminaea rosea TaxID=1569628 RepID=A0A316V1B4_9BASI|nr:FAD dependent oxidoreductase [Jaminaea rosea]PWN29973.1 FAD dependent oxidoreductase [Jaminaea rosea]